MSDSDCHGRSESRLGALRSCSPELEMGVNAVLDALESNLMDPGKIKRGPLNLGAAFEKEL